MNELYAILLSLV